MWCCATLDPRPAFVAACFRFSRSPPQSSPHFRPPLRGSKTFGLIFRWMSAHGITKLR